MEEMDFKTFLQQKKIDPKGFAQQRQEEYVRWEKLFDQVHPNSFTAQKLFLINQGRREFPLPKEEEAPKVKKAMPKPKMIQPKRK